MFSRLHTQSQMAVAPLRQMHEAFRALTPEITTTTAQTDLQTNAVQRAALALRSQTAAGAELVSAGLAAWLPAARRRRVWRRFGKRRAASLCWQKERGRPILPPSWRRACTLKRRRNMRCWPAPAAIVTAPERAGYGARDAGHGFGARVPNPQIADPELAPGAAGASARFSGSGVVIIRGTQDFENYVASAVNGAVARGVNVTATSAQRGSPVGH